MTDPSPIPWGVVWVGCVIAMTGAVVAMSGWGQREPRRMDVFGKWVAGAGVTLVAVTLLFNGTVFTAKLCGDIIKTVIASAQPSPEMQAPTR